VSAEPEPGLSLALARHAAAVRCGGLPAGVAAATRASVLDQVGVILAASGLAGASRPFVRLARDAAPGPAVVIGHGLRTGDEAAAFANGAMAHALDFEDTHDATLVHPHAAVLPAALAVAQATGASGAELLAAVAAGADVACRIAMGFESNPERPDGFTVIPVLGVYGATAAVGRLLGSPPDRIVQGFSLALGLATGSAAAQRDDASHWRAVRDGFLARAAITAARLAHLGVDGFARPLEGPAGLYALYGGGRCDAHAALRGLGERFEGTNVSFKPWPSCRGTHAFVEAALELAEAHALCAGDVRAVRARVAPFFRTLCEPRTLRARPGTSTSARFSIPFAIGVALARRRATLEDFDGAALRDPAVLGLADRVTHEVVDAWGAGQSTRGAVRIECVDGRVFEREVLQPRGHPANPMSADELRGKFNACAAHAAQPMDAARITRIAARIGELDALPGVADLFD
jgi:2-methylcitrate dehydratase PrpD